MARVTSRDVAREAGVSVTTVSFVLNGRDEHGISAETQRQVHEAARRLGYVPSAAARSLRLGRSNVVMCLVPDTPVTEATEVFKRELSDALAAAGYVCAVVHVAGVRGPLSQVWRHINPAAVISLGALPQSDVDALGRQDIPVVHNLLEPGGASLRGLSQEAIGRLLVRHLAGQGHRRIGFGAVADPREEPFCRPRLDGARQACQALGLPEPVVAVLEYERESARAALAVWRSAGPVTAVAAFNDLVALAVLGACRTDGVAVPGELALIGVDDLPVGAISVPALSTIAMDQSVPARDLAARAISLVGGPAPADPGDDPDIYRVIHRETS